MHPVSNSSTQCAADGFTLLEVMVTVIIGAILVVIAVPSFNSLIQGSRIVGDASALMNDLTVVRSEAVKRRANVVVCASGDGVACSGSDWSRGWLIYLDADADNALTGTPALCPPTPTTTADCFLRQHAAISDGNQIVTHPTISELAFRPDGTVRNMTATEQFQICTSRQVYSGRERAIRVEVSGHVSQEAITCP